MKIIILVVTLFCHFSLFADEELSAPQQLEAALANNKGNVVYLDFWASWCIPCRQSFPWMSEVQAKYQQQGFKVITVNLDADKANADEFLAQLSSDLTVIYDAKGLIARAYKLKGMPSSIVFDRQGQIVARHTGFNQEKKVKYQQHIEQLLTVN
ncbi:TlpA disulfide reductase family protein [Colwellia sp. MEBiC06753]